MMARLTDRQVGASNTGTSDCPVASDSITGRSLPDGPVHYDFAAWFPLQPLRVLEERLLLASAQLSSC